MGSPKERREYVKDRRRRAAAPDDRRRRAIAQELAGSGPSIDPGAGFLRLAPGALEGAEAVIGAATALIGAVGDEALEAGRKKPMAKGFLPAADLTADSPYLRFALSDGVLAPVAGYLGLVPVLTYVDVWHSAHVPREPFSSQLWHLDHADVTQVKVFLHCDDVERDSGPLTVLDSAASARLAKRLGYTFADSRVADQDVRRIVGDDAGVALTGGRGSAALVDTSRCFHFGSRVAEGARPRKLVVFQFLTPFAFDFQDDHRAEAPLRHLAGETSSVRDRLVLGAL